MSNSYKINMRHHQLLHYKKKTKTQQFKLKLRLVFQHSLISLNILNLRNKYILLHSGLFVIVTVHIQRMLF